MTITKRTKNKVQNRFNSKVNEYLEKSRTELAEFAQTQHKLPSKIRISTTDFAALEFAINIKEQQENASNKKSKV